MWYLSFYCNPRIQLAVVSKILMEGLRVSATLYGEFMEQYVYCELEVGEQEVEDRTKEQTSMIFNTESSIYNSIKCLSLFLQYKTVSRGM